MSEWTNEARTYLSGYLQQVHALALERGDDPQEITEQLRDHVERELAQQDLPLISLDRLRRVLGVLGTPEQVLDMKPLPTSPAEPSKPAVVALNLPRSVILALRIVAYIIIAEFIFILLWPVILAIRDWGSQR